MLLWDHLRNAGIDTENKKVRGAVEETWQFCRMWTDPDDGS
jgi:hypothetical protein